MSVALLEEALDRLSIQGTGRASTVLELKGRDHYSDWADFVEIYEEHDLDRDIFFQEVSLRSGYGEQLSNWAYTRRTPSGWVRAVLINCAREIALEARQKLSVPMT